MKRLKSESSTSSRIFQAYRALGYVSDDLPFHLHLRGKEYFLTVSVGNTFQIYDFAKFKLKMVGEPLPSKMNAFTGVSDYTFCACGSVIYKYKRMNLVSKMAAEGGNIIQMMVFGSHLLALHENQILRIWDFEEEEIYTVIELNRPITFMMHPSTYVNKILLASSDGKLQLWNIRKNALIYEFSGFGSAVTCVEQSPVVDVVCVGCLSGELFLFNLKEDKIIFKLQQQGMVTSIAFRTDDQPVLASSNDQGMIFLWHLEERRILHCQRDAHESQISNIEFIHGQPVLISSGSDNSIKQWTFDALDGVPRLLKQRSGHYAPPTFTRFYDLEGRYVLSGGQDRTLRSFCLNKDEQNMELSQGSLTKKAKSLNQKVEMLKLPPILQFSSSLNKEREWDNILTCHQNYSIAKTWAFKKKSMGQHEFRSQDGSDIHSVHVSYCGNFGLIGCCSGRIDLFNMQSGLYQRSFLSHQQPVTFMALDRNNKRLISASLDGQLKFWDFKSTKMLLDLSLGFPIEQIHLNRENNLLAVSTNDYSVQLFDIDTQKKIRQFKGHHKRITDLAFSPDGKWLLSSSLDGTIKTWDIQSSYLVDVLKVSQLPTSIAFSPKGDFLVSTHADSLGIYLWANRLIWSQVSLGRVMEDDETINLAELPSIISNQIENPSFDFMNQEMKDNSALMEEYICLSSQSKSQWQNLLHLDLIKKKNKPKEKPKAPEKAPFFLPVMPGLTPKFALEDKPKSSNEEGSRILKFSDLNVDSEMTMELKRAAEMSQLEHLLSYLTHLEPSQMDFEIRSLSTENDFHAFKLFLNALLEIMNRNLSFDLCQAWLQVFMKIHGDILYENRTVFKDTLQQLEQVQQQKSLKLEQLFQQTLCMMEWIRDI